MDRRISNLEALPDPRAFRQFMETIKNGQVRIGYRGLWVDVAPFEERLRELENQIVVIEIMRA